MNELRREPLLGRWIVVMSESLPPEAYTPPVEKPLQGRCNICTPEVKEILKITDEKNQPRLMIYEDSERIFTFDGELERRGQGMYDLMNSIGTTEVVVESFDHNVPPEEIGDEQVSLIVDVFHKRMVEIENEPKIRQVLIYKNCGIPSGDTCGHPHSLITATPVIPKRLKDELDGAKNYYEYKERCIFCDFIREEQRIGQRIVIESDHFIVFCPFAARFSFEFWILPKRHNCSFKDTTEEERRDLAIVLRKMILKLRRLLKDPPYNYVLHTAPARIPRRAQWHTLGDDFHWHIEVMPRIRRLTAFELGSGMYTITTSPEDAAKYLKEVNHGD